MFRGPMCLYNLFIVVNLLVSYLEHKLHDMGYSIVVWRFSGLGACSYPPKPNEFCTTSSAASGSSWPCSFRRALKILIAMLAEKE